MRQSYQVLVLAAVLSGTCALRHPRAPAKVSQRLNTRPISFVEFDEWEGEDRDHSLALDSLPATNSAEIAVIGGGADSEGERFDPASTLLTSRRMFLSVLKCSLLSLSLLTLTLRSQSVLKFQSKLGALLAQSSVGSHLTHLGLASAASACCGVQIVLNMLSFGCAGLNTMLGPFRPLFLSMAVAANAVMWMFGGADIPTLILKTGCVAVLSLLPEILFVYQRMAESSHIRGNTDVMQKKKWKKNGCEKSGSSGTWGSNIRAWLTNPSFRRKRIFLQMLSEHNSLVQSQESRLRGQEVIYEQVSYVIRSQGMGCSACTHKVQHVLDKIPTSTLVQSSIDMTRGIIGVTIQVPSNFSDAVGDSIPSLSTTSSSSIPDATTSSSESASPPCQATAGTRMNRMSARGGEKEDVRIVKNLCHELSAQGYPSNLIQRRELGQVSVSHSVD